MRNSHLIKWTIEYASPKENKPISMANLGPRDKHVLKMTICKGSDSEDVHRITVFPYLLINQLTAVMFKGQDHCVIILTQSCIHIDSRSEVFNKA